MKRRPLKFISREKEQELINRLETIVDHREWLPSNSIVLMVSPDYSATVAMHLAHAWSKNGDILPIHPVQVPYPDQAAGRFRTAFAKGFGQLVHEYEHFILVEAGIIRGSNWQWLLEEMQQFGVQHDQITLIALLENFHSKVKSDYVGEYYDDEIEDLTFYFEKFNKHWPS